MLSQTLALIAANVSIYLETVLLSARFVNVIPMIELTAIDVVVIFIWTFCVNRIFRKLFPARHILLLYEEYDPSQLLRKVNSRKDRYLIKKSMNVDGRVGECHERNAYYDAVFLCDIHSPLRNAL